MPSRPTVPCRCAIYTRQSRESHGDFSSCEAQFEACRQLILAQASQGWVYDGLRYDDEGQSGEALDRPGLTRLLADIAAGKIDRLVIHRIDRLSRKVAHCTPLIEQLREQGVALTIVTMPDFGSSASSALMLNLLSSFAEFERDLFRAFDQVAAQIARRRSPATPRTKPPATVWPLRGRLRTVPLITTKLA